MPVKPKKIPMRMCVGCRQMKPKKELLRVVRSPEGEVSLDPTGKKPGRGAYCCYSADCLKRALKQGQLDRQLEVKLTPEVNQGLTDTMNRLLEGTQARTRRQRKERCPFWACACGPVRWSAARRPASPPFAAERAHWRCWTPGLPKTR